MTKEEKLVVIDSLAEQLQAYPHFYIADIESLNAEQTAALRRKCFESDVKLVVGKSIGGSYLDYVHQRCESSRCFDQGVPQEVGEARPEGGFCRRMRLRG